ncbi:glycosyltransferase [Candidatus Poribacteria bacterium]
MEHKSYNPRISAVICTYRQPDMLAAAIESLLAQSLLPDDYEILVVDNNSQDATAEIVQSYVQDNAHRIRYVLETRQGLSYARNRGVQLAASDILAFLDDDAVADRDWLSSLLEVYDNVPDAWAVGGKILPIWDGERPKWLKDTMLRMLSIVDWGNEKRPLKWPERIIGANCSFRKQVFSEVGLFATDLGRRGSLLLGAEDTEIQERLHKLGKLVFYTPRAVVDHHVPCERMTKRYFYRRSYGSGRTVAILMTQQGCYGLVLKRLLMIGLGLPWIWLGLLWRILEESRRFDKLRSQAQLFGFVYQAIVSLLSSRDRRQL